jgi:hypothetical protein
MTTFLPFFIKIIQMFNSEIVCSILTNNSSLRAIFRRQLKKKLIKCSSSISFREQWPHMRSYFKYFCITPLSSSNKWSLVTSFYTSLCFFEVFCFFVFLFFFVWKYSYFFSFYYKCIICCLVHLLSVIYWKTTFHNFPFIYGSPTA